jgi:hypothetical protein
MRVQLWAFFLALFIGYPSLSWAFPASTGTTTYEAAQTDNSYPATATTTTYSATETTTNYTPTYQYVAYSWRACGSTSYEGSDPGTVCNSCADGEGYQYQYYTQSSGPNSAYCFGNLIGQQTVFQYGSAGVFCPFGYASTGTNCRSTTFQCASGDILSGGICTHSTYSCSSGDSLSGTTCTHTANFCPDGGTLNGTTCQKITYTCADGDTLSGSTCNHTYYYCPTGATLNGTNCTWDVPAQCIGAQTYDEATNTCNDPQCDSPLIVGAGKTCECPSGTVLDASMSTGSICVPRTCPVGWEQDGLGGCQLANPPRSDCHKNENYNGGNSYWICDDGWKPPCFIDADGKTQCGDFNPYLKYPPGVKPPDPRDRPNCVQMPAADGGTYESCWNMPKEHPPCPNGYYTNTMGDGTNSYNNWSMCTSGPPPSNLPPPAVPDANGNCPAPHTKVGSNCALFVPTDVPDPKTYTKDSDINKWNPNGEDKGVRNPIPPNNVKTEVQRTTNPDGTSTETQTTTNENTGLKTVYVTTYDSNGKVVNQTAYGDTPMTQYNGLSTESGQNQTNDWLKKINDSLGKLSPANSDNSGLAQESTLQQTNSVLQQTNQKLDKLDHALNPTDPAAMPDLSNSLNFMDDLVSQVQSWATVTKDQGSTFGADALIPSQCGACQALSLNLPVSYLSHFSFDPCPYAGMFQTILSWFFFAFTVISIFHWFANVGGFK